MNTNSDKQEMFEKIIETQFPRLLSQACRDVNSPFYGSFDRNWWHYRIRDFSSTILQQGGYTAYLCSQSDSFAPYEHELKRLAHAAALFWNRRAKRRGAFEEYYPWEQGYPPLAFSTLAMAKLALEEVVGEDEIAAGLKKAARQLQRRFESQAGNQQVAGLAALAVIRKIKPALVKEENYLQLKARTLALQEGEGWYTEYDGPDLGYLSVTLDCLWDLYDVTGDRDYLSSAEAALDFMHGFIVRRLGGAGMHNARNTDYMVPYGICRFLGHGDEVVRKKGATVMSLVFGDMNNDDHFFQAIDDRYWSHYIGHSVVRAQLLLDDKSDLKKGVISMKGKASVTKTGEGIITGGKGAMDAIRSVIESIGESATFAKIEESPVAFTYDAAGYIFRDLQDGKKRMLISAMKGGVFSLYDQAGTILSDYGWVARSGKKQFVNHWWSDSWSVNEESDSIVISGALFPHSEKISTPFLHFGLRVVSFVFGSALTRSLRNVLIFKSKTSDISFRRRIDLAVDSVIVTDTIEGIDKKLLLERAPRASKRHVASAGSWHSEDFRLRRTVDPMETIVRDNNSVVVTTIINLF